MKEYKVVTNCDHLSGELKELALKLAQLERKLGVDFPEGASATYLPSVGKVILRNTITNIKTFEKCLSVLNVIPYQVETEIQALLVTDLELARRIQQSSGSTNAEPLSAATEELFCLSLVTTSSHTSTNSLTMENAALKSSVSSGSYATFVTRPLVSPEGAYIQVYVKGELGFIIDKHAHLVYEIDTSLMIYNGASMYFWLAPQMGADGEKKVICVVVTARLIDPSGKILPAADESIAERLCM